MSDDVFSLENIKLNFISLWMLSRIFELMTFCLEIGQGQLLASKLFMGLIAMVLTYKLQDLYIKVSINNFQSFMMLLVRDIFSDTHSENCY